MIRESNVTTTMENIRPVEMIESRVCPWFYVDSHVMLGQSIVVSSLVPLSWELST